eukprot:38463-Eustigmatos_ZCMA.PRE.1
MIVDGAGCKCDLDSVSSDAQQGMPSVRGQQLHRGTYDARTYPGLEICQRDIHRDMEIYRPH